ncbi:MAG: S41 family peptidase [Caulobacteraceae bacterium]
MRKYFLIGASAFVLGAGSMAYVSQHAMAAATPKANTYRMLGLFGDVLDIVERQYVAPVDDTKLIHAALDGMLTSLDPHSNYLDPAGFDDMRDQTRGEYGGLGIEVTSEDGVVKVISPMDDTPATKAGIKGGDYITAIDGQSVVGLTLNDAVKLMRGKVGQKIVLSIAREGEESKDLTLTREIINVKSVKSHMEGDYGYLRLSAFNEKTGQETEQAIRSLEQQNPKMKGLILDLRNNPGGLLDQAIEVSDAFLDGGEVVSQRGRDPKDVERYNARPGDMLHGLPMVVMVNSGSASAAEIVAGALQDRHRAELVGITSFGKGSVQTVIPLRGGVDGALKLTTARYYTPSGRSIQRTGITPDLEVAQTRAEAQQIANRSFQFSEASFRNSLNADEGKIRVQPHEPAEEPPESFDEKKGDFQLARALEVLKDGGVAHTPKLPTPAPKLASVIGTKGAPVKPTAEAVTSHAPEEKPAK